MDTLDPTESIRGRIEKVVHCDERTGRCVLDVRCDPNKKPLLISVDLPSVSPGLSFSARFLSSSASPSVTESPHLPRQVTHFSLMEPDTKRSLKKFLKSGALGIIGPATVEQLSERFPGQLFTILENEPERLLEINGIGPKRKSEILSGWLDYRERLQVERFFFGENLPVAWARVLLAAHGRNAIEHFTSDPYRTVHEYRFAFETVDAFALKRGFKPESPERLSAGIEDLLRNHFQKGHCAYPENRLIPEAERRLGVSQEAVEEALELGILREHLVTDEIEGQPCIYTKETWDLEREVALRLLSFTERKPDNIPFNPLKAVSWAQSLLEIQLSPGQKEAVETSLTSALTVITGGPGTGKTTLIRCLVTILESQFIRFALCSPTGRAAQRLRETTGANATTIHRLLRFDGVTGRFGHGRENPLDVDFLLVDEASMIDLELMSNLLSALPDRCSLVLVGDANQLPSVGAGAVLRSIISSNRFPVVRLEDMFRQSADSGIRLNAERIQRGLMPSDETAPKNDFRFVPVRDTDSARATVEKILEAVSKGPNGTSSLARVQILTPTNQGPLGSRQLNEDLRHLFTKYDLPETASRYPFRLGDKVMVTKNDYKKNVFNGDVGFVREMNVEHGTLGVDFGERLMFFTFDELDSLTLAYAISIHKSQGSEYEIVIVVLTEEHLSIAQRHLVYTAVTRGKKKVFLVAEPKALRTAISRSEIRWQKLTALLSV